MKISQSNFNLQSPDSNLVRSYLIATVQKKILIRKIFHPTISFQITNSQGRTIRLSRLNAWKGHLANFSHKYWSKTFM